MRSAVAPGFSNSSYGNMGCDGSLGHATVVDMLAVIRAL